jgi:hypothetical protein
MLNHDFMAKISGTISDDFKCKFMNPLIAQMKTSIVSNKILCLSLLALLFEQNFGLGISSRRDPLTTG